MKRKYAKLAFRGFELPAEELVHSCGVPSYKYGNKGERTRPDKTSTWPRSFANFRLEFDDDDPLDSLIPKLFSFVGGVGKIADLRQRFAPEFLSVELFLPGVPSDITREGFFPVSALDLLVQAGCDLGLNFFEL
jgi:hypothetical protein